LWPRSFKTTDRYLRTREDALKATARKLERDKTFTPAPPADKQAPSRQRRRVLALVTRNAS
jgi:hypothetical protein